MTTKEAAVTDLRDFTDYDAMRANVYDGVVTALQSSYPIGNTKYSLGLSDLHYDGPSSFSLKDQKDAILKRKSLYRRLRGTWHLSDKATGQDLDKQDSILMHVPFLTQRGTYIMGGNEWTIASQMRLKPGVFTRKKDNGDLEAHFNVKGGPGFRLFMEPKTGVFKMEVGQASLKLYPVFRALGLADRDLQKWWGPELFAANVVTSDDNVTVNKLKAKLAGRRASQETGDMKPVDLPSLLASYRLDPAVTSRTLGRPYANISPETMLRATQKLINISKGVEDTDDRDSLAFQETWSADDFFKERIARDSGRLGARALWRATLRKNLSGLRALALNPQLEAVFYRAGVGQPLEEINPLDNLDQNLRVTRMGEGGISSADAIPDEARNLQPSHLGFIDPVKTPESLYVGVDSRLALNTRKGSDGVLYTKMRDANTGKQMYVSPSTLVDSCVAFPLEIERSKAQGLTTVKAMLGGRPQYVPLKDVDYEVPSSQSVFTHTANLVPLIAASKGGRLLMGSRMQSQALPLKDPESPLVQSLDPNGKSFYASLSPHMGAVHADKGGVVLKVSADAIVVKQADGVLRTHELYNNMPFNRKTFLNNTPVVEPGDDVASGQLLAASNFTDSRGEIALGKNLRVGYFPYRGLTFEDAVVISGSAANRLTSEHMVTESMDSGRMTAINKNKYQSIFPSAFGAAQLQAIDKNGVVAPGSIVSRGDPLILGVEERAPKASGMLYSGRKTAFRNSAVTWDRNFKGEVTDVWRDDGGTKVAIKYYAPAEVGDKLCNRYGGKGVISAVIDDDRMPMDSEGRPLEIVINPLTIISRGNPAQLMEAVLGKIAARRNKPYVVPGFMSQDLAEYTLNEMKLHNVSDTEDLTDPVTGRKIPDVLVGNAYYLKLHHLAEEKHTGRALGSYTMEGQPSPGAPHGEDDVGNPKRVGTGEMQALLGHGAIENIKDVKLNKGQRNDDYWRAMTLGYPPPSPDIPNAYKKFIAMLNAAGINTKKEGNYVHLTALTDADVDRMSSGEIRKPETVKWLSSYARGFRGEKSLEPVDGGLFDRGITGGHGGSRWSSYTLSEPVPQPSMEDPIRHLLGFTRKEYEEVVAGSREIQGVGSGGRGIQRALERIKVDDELGIQEQRARTASSAAARDEAVKLVGYLRTMKERGLKPKDMVITKVPILPPVFRPISATEKFNIVAGVNLLYMDLMHADNNLKTLSASLQGRPVDEARLAVYKSLKAVTGLGDPIKPIRTQQGVRGLLKEVFGDSPKLSQFQHRLIGTSVDLAGRAVITPNPTLNMDQVGIPRDEAWKLYGPFVVRRLIRGMGNTPEAKAAALRMVSGKTSAALEALQQEMEVRPVLVTRAPALHRYSLMAFMPVLSHGKTLELAPPVTHGYNADFNGDSCTNAVVPVKINGDIFVGSFEQIIRRCAQPGYCEADAIELYGGGTQIFDLSGSDVKVLGLSADNKADWVEATAISIHMSHADECYRVKSTRGLNTVFTAHHNFSKLADNFELQPCKTTSIAPGDLLPSVRRVPVSNDAGDINDFEKGFWLGHFIADGAITGRNDTVSQASTDTKLLTYLEHCGRHFSSKTAWREGNGFSTRWTDKKLVSQLEAFGRGAANKQFPSYLFDTSALFRKGLIAGYLAGEGNVQSSSIRVECVSRELLLQFKFLLATLGAASSLRCGKPAKVKRQATHVLHINTVGFFELDIPWPDTRVCAKFDAFKPRAFSHQHINIVPFSPAISAVCHDQGKLWRTRRGRCARPSISKDMGLAARRGFCTRALAEHVIASYNLDSVDIPAVRNWCSWVKNTTVGWDIVESVSPASRPPITYDFSVSGNELFCVDGLFLTHNTMNFHVVVSDEAIKEARKKMLPSKNLRSIADFGILWAPRQEFLQGLYVASTKRNGKRMLPEFENGKDVADAFKRGELNIDDVISVKERK